MLVLSRKSHQAVVVGGIDGVAHLVTVTVLEIQGTKVKLGFESPGELPIHRHEVWQRIRDREPGDAVTGVPQAPLG